MTPRLASVFLAAALAVAAMSFAMPARAADQAWDDCAGDDPDKSIAGCTIVLKRGNDETAENQAKAHFDRAIAYRAKENLDAAMADYDAALKLNPDYAFAYFNRGRLYRDMGNNQAAVENYTEAIRVDPSDHEAFYVRANAYRDLKEYDKAIADYDEAVRLKPDYSDAIFNRGNVHSDLKEYDKAIADFTEVIRLTPKDADAYYNRGNGYYNKDEYPPAIADYSIAIALAPEDAPSYRSRANAYYMNGNYAQAIVDYDASLKIDPGNESAKASRADAVAALAKGTGNSGTLAATEEPSGEQTEGNTDTSSETTDKGSVVLTEKRVALVIGNSAYASVTELANPKRDAEAVAGALRRAGFIEVTVVDDVGRQAFLDALYNFADTAAGADWAVIYFAGHGIELEGTNYLIPVDASLKTDRSIRDETISLDRMIETVEGAKKLRLVILDACRNNPFVAQMKPSNGTRAIHRGLARVEPEGGTLVAYAAKGGQEAIDGDDAENSPFAAALVKRLTTPGLEVDKMFRLVRDDVLAATARKQEPFTYGSLPGEDLSFMPK